MLMVIVFACRYPLKPSYPPSRPYPLCLTPPKGVCGDVLYAWLMPTFPASIFDATRSARGMSDVKTDAVKDMLADGRGISSSQ